ncbi:MAG: hypothetical protein CMM26_09285 [Rhodospirillaceae bacterium]|nr:hypothetical protein [Rhodospirillaceae bacterium]
MTPLFPSITACLDAACHARADNELFTDPEERLTGREVSDQVERVASGLLDAGYRTGNVVAFLCGPSVRHLITFFACQRIGLVPCAFHVNDSTDRLAQTVMFINAKALFADQGLAEKAEAIAGEVPVVFLGGDGNSLDTYLETTPGALPDSPPAPDDPALILMSSGTTGEPKCILHTHATLAAMTPLADEIYRCSSPDDSVIVIMPPAFAAWAITTIPMLSLGARFYLDPNFAPDRFLLALQDERITLAPLVPTIWRMVLEAGPEEYDLSAVRSAFFSGEPGSADLVDALSTHITPNVCTAFLASEGCAASAIVAGPDILVAGNKPEGAGRPVSTAVIRIIDPEGSLEDILPAGEVGEIALQSPSLSIGYLNKPALTAEKFVDGWWRSGDLGLMDAEGVVFVKGRTDNQINTGGVKVRAEEIEVVLLQHPDVANAAVVGEPDETWGERIEAHVVSRDPDLTEKLLLDFLEGGDLLPRRLLPKAVHFHDALPTGATGKLYRRGLRQTGSS